MNDVKNWLNENINSLEGKSFTDVVKVEDATTESMGDGQIVVISDIRRVTLSLVTTNGNRRKLKAIAKMEPSADIAKGFAESCGAFVTEQKMYGDILKSMEKLMSEIGDEEYLWAHCYHAAENKFLFEDLCESGYRIVPTHKFLDLKHITMVMKAVGKYHAMTMVMKERSLLDLSVFGKPYYARNEEFMNIMITKTFQYVVDNINKWGPEWSEISQKFSKFVENPGELLENTWDSSRGKWDVLCHGDFSMRNMMFHYPPDSDEPDDIKFIDFQMCHYSNLANDLIMLLHSSIMPQKREENIKEILSTYLDSLVSTCKRYGYKGRLPTLDDVKACVRELQPLSVLMSCMSIPMFVTSGKEDLQKKTNEYLEKYKTAEEVLASDEEMSHMNFGYEEVGEMLKFELKKWVNDKLF